MTEPAKPPVLIVHPTPLIAAGLAAALHEAFSIQMLPEAQIGSLADVPAVAIADHRCGMALVAHYKSRPWLRRCMPRCLVVTSATQGWHVRQALEQGVHGYLSTDCGMRELLEAVRCVYQGQRVLCALASASMADSVAQESLTPRETDVLMLLAQGLDNKSISARLQIALGTVKSHVKAVLEKLAASSRTQAVATAHQRGLVGQGFAGRRIERSSARPTPGAPPSTPARPSA